MLGSIPMSPRFTTTTIIKERLAAEGFDVSERTIQRDLSALSIILPLSCDEEKQGYRWYFIKAPDTVPAMSPSDALAFVMVERYLESMFPTSTLAQLETRFEKAKSVLNTGSNSLTHWKHKICLLPSGLSFDRAKADPEIIDVVYSALLEEKQVEVSYLKRGAQAPQIKRLNPLALIVRNTMGYLIATEANSEQVKQFALHRIQHIEATEIEIEPKADFDLDSYVASGSMGFIKNEEQTITLQAIFRGYAAQTVQETPFAEDQKTEEWGDSEVIVKATVNNTFELESWLLSLGPCVEVLKPQSLRERLIESARATLAQYQS
jgi:predicted DNA-binding transcriptional regulator YafY